MKYLRTIPSLFSVIIFTLLSSHALCDDKADVFSAADSGDVEKLKILLGSNPNLVFVKDLSEDNEGMTPLHHAAFKGQKGAVELLLAKGADVNAKTKYNWTPLHFAASMGHKSIAELLLAKGADVNAKHALGWTPLHDAASRGRKDVAELLLANGADVDAKNNDNGTPLFYAAGGGYLDVVELLLTKGADVNAKADSGITPTQSALKLEPLGGGRKDVVDYLRQHGGQ